MLGEMAVNLRGNRRNRLIHQDLDVGIRRSRQGLFAKQEVGRTSQCAGFQEITSLHVSLWNRRLRVIQESARQSMRKLLLGLRQYPLFRLHNHPNEPRPPCWSAATTRPASPCL